MEHKRDLSLDEMGKISGGATEAYGIDTDRSNDKKGIPIDNTEVDKFKTDPFFGSSEQFPVYCRNCKRLLGYTKMRGTTTFTCQACHTNNYG